MKAKGLIPAVLSYIKRSDGALLCVWNRNYREWGLPGGRIEPNESFDACQARELEEETGLDTESARHFYTGLSRSGRLVFVYAVVTRGWIQVEELNTAVGWMSPDILLEHGDREFYEAVFKVAP
jgi:ADP-ribose pyrophosphatase YjhB (NUDIX family)